MRFFLPLQMRLWIICSAQAPPRWPSNLALFDRDGHTTIALTIRHIMGTFNLEEWLES
jgi:hypothetical protein